MHDVDDLAAFDRLLDLVTRRFVPVGLDEVLACYRDRRPLPDRAVWLTFDDGDRSTIVDAAPVLRRHGVRATAFVCPGLIENETAPWWDVVLRASGAGRVVEIDGRELRGQAAVTALKHRPDEERRRIVAALAEHVGWSADHPVSVEDLERWRDLGGDIGNHTWDHPCLDRCDPQAQFDQIDRAADWLDERGLWDHRVFAYPNGDRTEDAERHLADRGYELVALFDHHLTARRPDPLRVSRLRLDATASAPRVAAVTSGVHSGLFSLRSDASTLGARLRR